MQSWQNKPVVRLVSFPLALAGFAYPFIYYAMNQRIPPLAFGVLACLLLLARLRTGGQWLSLLRWPLVAAIILIGLLALLSAELSARAYPSVMSWAFALLFAHSLSTHSSLVERFATLRGNDLPTAGRLYCRKVTLTWAIWLFLNGIIAAILAWQGNLEAWTLWTGLVSYAISGVLFAIEFSLRRWMLRGHGVS